MFKCDCFAGEGVTEYADVKVSCLCPSEGVAEYADVKVPCLCPSEGVTENTGVKVPCLCPSEGVTEYTDVKVEFEVLSYRQTDTVISVYMVRYRYIINNQVKTG